MFGEIQKTLVSLGIFQDNFMLLSIFFPRVGILPIKEHNKKTY